MYRERTPAPKPLERPPRELIDIEPFKRQFKTDNYNYSDKANIEAIEKEGHMAYSFKML